jgi:hypothetical protein
VKKLGVLSLAFVLVLAMSGVGAAASYYFSDTIDSWGSDDVFGRVRIPNYPGTYDYQHDITDDVDFAAGDLVTNAYLALDFDWDFSDSIGIYSTHCNYTIAWDNTEYSFIQFDDSGWQFVDEVDNSYEFLTVGIDWLNDDGLLDVSLTVLNYLGTASAWLDSSTLFGWADTGSGSTAPIPEPGTMILLGMGVMSIAAPGRKTFFKNKLRRHML